MKSKNRRYKEPQNMHGKHCSGLDNQKDAVYCAEKKPPPPRHFNANRHIPGPNFRHHTWQLWCPPSGHYFFVFQSKISDQIKCAAVLQVDKKGSEEFTLMRNITVDKTFFPLHYPRDGCKSHFSLVYSHPNNKTNTVIFYYISFI